MARPTDPPRPRARFDDLRPGRRRSFELREFERVLVARTYGEVPAVLDEVEAATRDGRWAAGFVAYEAAPAFDPAYRVRTGQGILPAAWFGLFERRGPAPDLRDEGGAYEPPAWQPSVEPDRYREAVTRIRDLIRDGHTYQVNYSMRLEADFAGDPLGLYRDLALAQSAGYGAFIDTGRHVIAGASPELFFEWDGRTVTTRPMKGTAPRGRWSEEDLEHRDRLLDSEKDRAENLMIVDLIRNDLGRIADVGSVRVERLFEAERFDTVWQLTSTITASVPAAQSLNGLFAALFPCGSVTGAPKVRTMEIIADVETRPRGIYCGAVGFVAPPDAPGPRAAFNVAIRTIEIDTRVGAAVYGTGGGVTWSSRPEGEHTEALVKARVLTRAGADFDLLETLRWDPDQGWWWPDRHLDRLVSSAAYFGRPCDRDEIRRVLGTVAGGADSLRVRLTLNRTGVPSVSVAPVPPAAAGPVRLAIDDVPVDPFDPFLFHKTTRRSIYEEAAARHPGADDVVLVNDRDEVTETTIANIAANIGGRWLTPPLDSGCLPGVHRAALLADDRIAEAPLPVEAFCAADEIAVFNSVRGWAPARLLAADRPTHGA